MENNIKDFHNIDCVKIIMAVLVISLHTKPMIGCANEAVKNVYYVFANSAVPFFFMASGYLIGYRSSGCDASYIKRSVIKYIKLYIMWNCVYLPLTIYGYVSTDASVGYAIKDFIQGLFITGEHYNSWMMWYLLSAIYAFIYIYIHRGVSIQKKSQISFIWLVIMFVSEQLLLSSSNSLLNVYGIRLHAITRLSNGVFYIPLGICISQSAGISALRGRLLAAGVVFSILLRQIDVLFLQYISELICSVSLFLLIIKWKAPARLSQSFYVTIRNISSYMYFLHMYVWTFLCLIIYKESYFGLKAFIITSVLSILLSWIIVSIAHTYKKLKYG